MRVLLTNVQLHQRTGTEIVVRDLEAGLRRRGHEVAVYAPLLGDLAREITAAGGTVVDDLGALSIEPDVIHGHHHLPVVEALVRFPDAAAIFVCHDRTSHHDIPVATDRIGRYVAVDLNCDERLAIEAGIPATRRAVIHNAVDLRRHPPRGALPSRPRRAAVLSNNARPGGFLDAIGAACEARGIELDVFGSGVDSVLSDPGDVLGGYDVVFAKARSALEAMAAGCAVVLVDQLGLGEVVSADRVAELRDWNFGGRCLQSPVDAGLVDRQLDRYDPVDARAVTDWVRREADLERALDRYVDLYTEVIADRAAQGPSATSWIDLHRGLLEHAGRAEAVARRVVPATGTALPPTVGREVDVALVGPRLHMRAGATTSALVEVHNHSRETLASEGALPVHLACRWVDARGAAIGGEPERTALTRAVGPGEHHVQPIRVVVPESSGTLGLRADLVQEGRFWWSDLEGWSTRTWEVAVEDDDGDRWTLGRLSAFVPIDVVRDAPFAELGFAADDRERMLTFGESERFVDLATAGRAACIVVPPGLVDRVPGDVGVASSSLPKASFARIHELLATRSDFYGPSRPTYVDPTARIDPSAHVDLLDVEVGPGARIGPHATVTGRVRIGADVVIGAGVHLGSTGFQTVVVDGRPTEMVHAGGVEIGDEAVVMAGAVIARGVFRDDTIVGSGARIGNLAFVSHRSNVGARSFVGHGAVVNGNVSIGADCWIGPGATITNNVTLGDGCRVSLGATVFGDVDPGAHLTGLAAIEHSAALRAAARLRRPR